MESSGTLTKITFRELQIRLLRAVSIRILNGDFTERGLARILGISQPQIHNVLKGARRLRPELADRLIGILEISVLDLLEVAELRQQLLAFESSHDPNAWDAIVEPATSGSKPARKRPSAEKNPTKLPSHEQAS